MRRLLPAYLCRVKRALRKVVTKYFTFGTFAAVLKNGTVGKLKNKGDEVVTRGWIHCYWWWGC